VLGPVNRFLLTSAPRTGKTTLACKLARELRISKVTVVEDFSGRRAVMAHVAWTSGPRVGRYHVDVAAFDGIAIPAIEQALGTADVMIVDELGQMELCSAAFTRTIDVLFSAAMPLVATVHARRHPVTDTLKERSDVELIELSATNRDEVPTRILTRLGGCDR
jgi:nucleoside-triphosphatase